MINNKQIILLEGMPGAGKSSILEYLKKQSTFNIALFPQITARSNFNINKVDEYFLKKELIRSKSIKNIHENTVIIDRGIYSHLAYAHAFERIQSLNKGKFNHLCNLYELFYKERMYKENFVFFLNVDNATGIVRRKRYKNNSNYMLWFDDQFLSQLRESYVHVFAKYEVTPIIIDTTYLNKEIVQHQVEQYIKDTMSYER